jgi:dissimilatory sulfite reductase (desulfoviridin) alpha/beta subunit
MAVDYATLKKGGFMRQKQKNNFSLRLRVVGGNLSAKQLSKIAEVADKFGDGHVHLTSRQSVEIPFIKLDDIEEVKNALAEGDVEPGVCGPRVRTITACQGQSICPSGCIDTYALAKELDERYFARELPHKFKFGITGCQNNCLKSEENDLGIKGGIKVSWREDKCIGCGVCEKACRQYAITITDGKVEVEDSKCNFCGRCYKACPTEAWDIVNGYIVSFGGLFGNSINKGETIIPFIEDKEKLMKICDTAIHFFEDNANAGERFKFTIDRVGREKFENTILEAYNG